MIEVNLSLEAQEIENKLAALGGRTKFIKRNIANKLATETLGSVKRGYSRTLKKRSRSLYSTIRKKVLKDGSKALVYPSKKYGFILARGATIRPVKNKVLIFKIGDRWIRKHEIILRPRNWFDPSASAYLDSRKPESDMMAILQKELERVWKS